MCGICGLIVKTDNQLGELGNLLTRMTELLVHRGPDEKATWHEGAAGLGHTRLKVLDLEGSKQPMLDITGRYLLVYNGEVYNFQELRRELKSHHCMVFRYRGDTEVVLNAFVAFGKACLHKFNGMFAFGLWDRKEQTLFLARDRMGQKPLFYYTDSSMFVFASEIKCILSIPGIDTSLDYSSLDSYFKYGFIPSPDTIFKRIKKLPPAHYLIYKDNNFAINRYWSPPLPTVTPSISIQEASQILRHKMERAVRLRLISDVPLGAFLSGGIDSSAIVALMRENSSEVKTFCISFRERSYDESRFSKLSAEHFHTDHTEYMVKDYQVESLLKKLVFHFDEPFGDSSALPTYHLSRITRQYVTVALSGDGGDELFAGYNRYIARRFAHYYNLLPKSLRTRFFNNLISMLPDNTRYYAKSIVKSLKLFHTMALSINRNPLSVLPNVFEEHERKALYSHQLLAQLCDAGSKDHIIRISEQFSNLDEISHMMWVDMHTYLPDDILVKVDRMSMAHSLEVRSPFMDHEVVEFICTLPIDYKLKGFTTKYILKTAMNDLLPKTVLKRRKQGFSVPLAVWFRKNLRELVHDYMFSKEAAELLRLESIKQLLIEHQEKNKDNSHRLWTLLIFCVWLNEYC